MINALGRTITKRSKPQLCINIISISYNFVTARAKAADGLNRIPEHGIQFIGIYIFLTLLSYFRVLYKLNVQIMDTLGSVSTSLLPRFSVSAARLAYLDICDVCTTLTRAFQTQLFINIVGNVFGVTFMMLSAFNTLMSNGANTIQITLYFLYESLIRMLQMYFVIDACHTTVEQVKTILY